MKTQTTHPLLKTNEYRTVKLSVSQESLSRAWFYTFGFEWVWYRSNQGFKTYSDAREAGENHIDRVLGA